MSRSRTYQFAFKKNCPRKCFYCKSIGNKGEKDLSVDAMDRVLEKATSGEYKSILLPCHLFHSGSHLERIDEIISKGFEVVAQINSQDLANSVDTLELWRKKGVKLEVVINTGSAETYRTLRKVEESIEFETYLLPVHKAFRLQSFLHHLNTQQLAKIRLYFPFKSSEQDLYLTSGEMGSLFELLSQRIPEFRPQPPEGVDIFDHRVHPEIELEPILQPVFQFGKAQIEAEIEVSVIIPAYNNKDYLLCTLRHLLQQDFPKEKFEIIIIDDGSNDGTQHLLYKFLKDQSEEFQVQYFYFPRPQKRQMGDGQFRAGIARNLGVKNAKGRILAFLDSDIVTPKNYLTQILKDHEKADVVQHQRLNLVREKSHRNTKFSEIDRNKDVFEVEDGYWEKFYRQGKQWNKIPFGWKYVCTYGLSLPKALFKEVGWFRKSYIFYGFEDTDLGYRLQQKACQFYLSDLVTYHLFHRPERSEFKNSRYLRQQLLSKTAKIFFHNTLNLEIYRHFRSLIEDSFEWSSLLKMPIEFFQKKPVLPVMQATHLVGTGDSIKQIESR